jgi:hypothetical protein
MESYRANTHMAHQAALKIAAKGRPVFPCKPDKSPYTPRGFHDATVDPAKVRMYWNRHRSAAIGVPTGDVSGLLVLDVDVDAARGLDGLADLGAFPELPETRTIRTPRGGLHKCFKCPAGMRGRNLTPALEVKANGQYVIVPPSPGYKVIDNSPIANAPEWLLSALREEPPNAEGKPGGPGPSPDVDLDEDGPIPEGSRNQTLFFYALDLKDAGHSREEVLERTLKANATRCTRPLSKQEVEGIVKSAMRYPVRSGNRSPEVEEFVGQLEADWWSRDWKGVAGKTDRDGKRVLIELARRYGRLTPDRQALEVSASVRSVALAAATSYVTVSRGMTKRLARTGQVVKLDAGRGPREAATWRLFAPAQLVNTQHSGGAPTKKMPCVNKLSAPQRKRLWDLETPAFRWRGLVGKGRGGVLYVLEAQGPMTEDDIAAQLGISPVGNVRRYLRGYHDKRRGKDVHGLLDLGLVEEREGVFSVVTGYEKRVEEVRNTRYASERKRRTLSPEEGRTVTDVETGVSLSEVEREADDLRRHREQQEKFKRYLAELRLIKSTHFEDMCEDMCSVPAQRARAEGRARHARRVAMALQAFKGSSGARVNLKLFADGDLHEVEYLCKAVLHYHGVPFDKWGEWVPPALEAGRAVVGELSEQKGVA